ncbi:hypothetical protein, partial [Sphingomonas sp. BE138]|uniref:hypothetical protein n=1 Tax=Sphingomonas sp. BE138 TaxID=2817845 RepID=UPI00286D1E98
MTDKELLRGLEEHHRVIRVGLALIQSHCATDCANIAGRVRQRGVISGVPPGRIVQAALGVICSGGTS